MERRRFLQGLFAGLPVTVALGRVVKAEPLDNGPVEFWEPEEELWYFLEGVTVLGSKGCTFFETITGTRWVQRERGLGDEDECWVDTDRGRIWLVNCPEEGGFVCADNGWADYREGYSAEGIQKVYSWLGFCAALDESLKQIEEDRSAAERRLMQRVERSEEQLSAYPQLRGPWG